MERDPTPKDLRGAAAVAQTLAYVAGVAGVIAGALLFLDSQLPFAIVVWLLTFVVGAGMMVAAALTRAVAVLLQRLAHVESDVTVLLRRSQDDDLHRPPDPYAHR